MQNKNYTTILAIPNFDESTLNEAIRIFGLYKKRKTIKNCCFDDPIWNLCDEYANFSFNFYIDKIKYEAYRKFLDMKYIDFINFLKTYIIYRMGELSLGSLQEIINGVKKIISYPIDDLSRIADDLSMTFVSRLIEFFSMLPDDGRADKLEYIADELEKVNDKVRSKTVYAQRKLAAFDSYFLFEEILNMFWEDSTDEEERLFFFPVYLWWKITGILPLRPREFVLTPRNCLKKSNGNWYLKLQKNKIKGRNKKVSYKIEEDYELVTYQIPEKLASEISWYIKNTKDFMDNDLNTLFVTDIHYAMWERNKPYTSRYFTYVNLSTCLRYFFEKIIKERYGYRIVFDRDCKYLKSNEIQYLDLGDTRHLSLINIIAEGATPMVAMMLAGHDNPEMTSHYYSNIANLIECKTYRQYKKLIKGEQSYIISKPQKPLSVSDFVIIDNDARCYSPLVSKGIFTDCSKVIGPAGEIGYCQNCTFYRSEGKIFTDSKELYVNQIINESKNLDEIVKRVRQQKGEEEEIIQAIMKLRASKYSYQQYLQEVMEVQYGKEEKNSNGGID